jgi:hypothetical protein
MPDWFSTTISVFAGGLLTLLAGWLADRRASAREREHRREERAERSSTRRNEFDRDTLLALQIACQKLTRNAAASLHQDVLAHRATGEWQKRPLPEWLSEDELLLSTEVMLFASRIRDDKVRSLALDLRIDTSKVLRASDKAEAEANLIAAIETHEAVIFRIGEIVRNMDDPPQISPSSG